jgi:hypothetical protein
VSGGIDGGGERIGATTDAMVESNGARSLANGASHITAKPAAAEPECKKRGLWFEEELEPDLRWVFGVSKHVPLTLFFFPLFSYKIASMIVVCVCQVPPPGWSHGFVLHFQPPRQWHQREFLFLRKTWSLVSRLFFIFYLAHKEALVSRVTILTSSSSSACQLAGVFLPNSDRPPSLAQISLAQIPSSRGCGIRL